MYFSNSKVFDEVIIFAIKKEIIDNSDEEKGFVMLKAVSYLSVCFMLSDKIMNTADNTGILRQIKWFI